MNHIMDVGKLNPLEYGGHRILHAIPRKTVPEMDMWRIPFLKNLLISKNDLRDKDDNFRHVQDWIDSLCTS